MESSQHYTLYQAMIHHNVANTYQPQPFANKFQPQAFPPVSDDTDSSEWSEEDEEDDDYGDLFDFLDSETPTKQKVAKKKVVKPKPKKKNEQPKPKNKGVVAPGKRKAVTAGPSKPKKKGYLGAEKGQGGEIMFELSMMRYATVGEFKGKVMVGIREYYEDGGKLLPSKKGISLSVDQWKRLKEQMKTIDKVVKDLS